MRLHAISAKFASSHYSPAIPVVEAGEIASDLIKDLHILVYRYSLSKIRKRANKITAEKWIQYQPRYREIVSQQQLEAYDEIIAYVDDHLYTVNMEDMDEVVSTSVLLEDQATSKAGKDLLNYLDNHRVGE